MANTNARTNARTVTSTAATHIAHAAMRIARANHYMVGFEPTTTANVSWDDWHDAHQLLIEFELEALRRADARGARNVDIATIQRLHGRAFAVLADACRRQHNCEP
jgi:hypothetical protein